VIYILILLVYLAVRVSRSVIVPRAATNVRRRPLHSSNKFFCIYIYIHVCVYVQVYIHTYIPTYIYSTYTHVPVRAAL
jgi:hypothetical protein